ncbi:hypothetical protein A3D00_05470 [Candidatus Woesebacteria bacterium RIFCSPHIGHO2_02_FULL_38_9]|uniref:Uncharacterized protein n=1 Tax=Candidatus Woesebacteria bacterium RIFCSPHIGHO2_01_FULL_39_28 TaxID=1802496 RepID=A0A1F7YL15_9BACT|nr:MAG: hypothetical protein A2627_00635 [Candidatus Woesebacteria bacterium RIFCSPHIGHO2_01_FULL_39_28]OGM33318.1 MAG: hypothetical protein A3D00_05470 [Candidatus Woesebacteria bacterium RIFCSPHIGHO2_02_FULL_38_9]OGM56682.1 MAG: hypothetical protein A3A50_04985 [Candidatus Woesebacteria bacterium RIFCSPLOWO2_01_FULL_38_20]
MNNLIAQTETRYGKLEGLGILGIGSPSAPNIFNSVLSLTIGLLSVVAGIWFLIQIIIGGIGIVGSGGDKAALTSARQKITNGLIGIIVVIAGVFIAKLIGDLLGIDILNPGNFVENANL